MIFVWYRVMWVIKLRLYRVSNQKLIGCKIEHLTTTRYRPSLTLIKVCCCEQKIWRPQTRMVGLDSLLYCVEYSNGQLIDLKFMLAWASSAFSRARTFVYMLRRPLNQQHSYSLQVRILHIKPRWIAHNYESTAKWLTFGRNWKLHFLSKVGWT